MHAPPSPLPPPPTRFSLQSLVESTWLGLRIVNSNFALSGVQVQDSSDSSWHPMDNPWVSAPRDVTRATRPGSNSFVSS